MGNKNRKAPEILQQSQGFAEDPEGILQRAPPLPCILFAKTVPEIFAQPAIQKFLGEAQNSMRGTPASVDRGS